MWRNHLMSEKLELQITVQKKGYPFKAESFLPRYFAFETRQDSGSRVFQYFKEAR